MYCGTNLNNNKIGGENLLLDKIKVKINGKLIEHCICRNCNGKKISSDKCIICQQKHEKDKIE